MDSYENNILVAPDRGGFVVSLEDKFIGKNTPVWQSLENFCIKYRNTAIRGNINPDEVREFARLLRLSSYHLAYAKTHFPNSGLVAYLNRIVGTAQSQFYASQRTLSVKKYFLETFPAAVRNSWKFWGLAAAFFALGMFFAAFYVAGDLYRLQDVLPGGMGAGFSPYEAPDFGDGSVDVDFSIFTAVIMTNNVAVAINAFALGVFAGLGTVYIMVLNGLVVGGLFGYFHVVGADMLIAYALVLPHGVLELIAIFICGGCGLMLGKGLLMPGRFTRRHSLIFHAKKAGILMPGVVTLLIIAAIIEGFFTPLAIAPEFKLIFAATTGIAFVAYCTLLWKEDPNEKNKNSANNI